MIRSASRSASRNLLRTCAAPCRVFSLVPWSRKYFPAMKSAQAFTATLPAFPCTSNSSAILMTSSSLFRLPFSPSRAAAISFAALTLASTASTSGVSSACKVMADASASCRLRSASSSCSLRKRACSSSNFRRCSCSTSKRCSSCKRCNCSMGPGTATPAPAPLAKLEACLGIEDLDWIPPMSAAPEQNELWIFGEGVPAVPSAGVYLAGGDDKRPCREPSTTGGPVLSGMAGGKAQPPEN
mmetsp:Transcript_98079/g.194172  ORF Transcript_98079/g.194172 Transcript_98079/m.194172 type:complete len:241 (+) Transcript_98079:886-1608(+)